MLLIIGELFARREESIVGASIIPVPLAAKNLLAPYRIVHF